IEVAPPEPTEPAPAASPPPPSPASDEPLRRALQDFQLIFAAKDQEKQELSQLCERIEALEDQLSRTEEYVRSVILARRQSRPPGELGPGLSP
ncbi:MAG TPA: hypothetical protein VM681_08505, partial [Candidatus Thermoplasmatota archaeon]|nr:hypothetical protein [Candidatus Thermoplasmatota archaeon]